MIYSLNIDTFLTCKVSMATVPKYLKIGMFYSSALNYIKFYLAFTLLEIFPFFIPYSHPFFIIIFIIIILIIIFIIITTANNYLVIDKVALKENGITDFFALPKEDLDACVAFYKSTLAATNSGDKSIVVTCEVSDWLAKAGCQ